MYHKTDKKINGKSKGIDKEELFSLREVSKYAKLLYFHYRSLSRHNKFVHKFLQTISQGSKKLPKRSRHTIVRSEEQLSKKGLIRVWIRPGTEDRVVFVKKYFDQEYFLLRRMKYRRQMVLRYQKDESFYREVIGLVDDVFFDNIDAISCKENECSGKTRTITLENRQRERKIL